MVSDSGTKLNFNTHASLTVCEISDANCWSEPVPLLVDPKKLTAPAASEALPELKINPCVKPKFVALAPVTNFPNDTDAPEN